MTLAEIDQLRQRLRDLYRYNDHFTPSQCSEVDIIIDQLNEHWERENMATKTIGKVSSKSLAKGKIKPIQKGSVSQKIAKAKKPARMAKGLKANVKARKAA